jgi:hypothetical protein
LQRIDFSSRFACAAPGVVVSFWLSVVCCYRSFPSSTPVFSARFPVRQHTVCLGLVFRAVSLCAGSFSLDFLNPDFVLTAGGVWVFSALICAPISASGWISCAVTCFPARARPAAFPARATCSVFAFSRSVRRCKPSPAQVFAGPEFLMDLLVSQLPISILATALPAGFAYFSFIRGSMSRSVLPVFPLVWFSIATGESKSSTYFVRGFVHISWS